MSNSSSTSLAESDLAALLRAAGGDRAVEFSRLLDRAQTRVVAQKRSTVAARKAATRQALEVFDADKLADLESRMAKFVSSVIGDELVPTHAVMSSHEAATMMERFIDQRDISELMAVCHDMIKDAVWAHLDEVGRAAGYDDPENHNGTIDVPECGLKFSREGAGYKDPTVDEIRLRAMLGDRYNEVCDIEVIPEHTEQNLSVEKLVALAMHDDEVMEALTECLVGGAPKTPRLWIRDL